MRVVVEGALGDWARRRYIPALLESLKCGTDFDPTLVDIRPPCTTDDYDVSRLTFLNKLENPSEYDALTNVDRVFIVTPDDTHLNVAAHWLSKNRLSEQGAIIVEKPLSNSTAEVSSFTSLHTHPSKLIAFLDLITTLHGSSRSRH